MLFNRELIKRRLLKRAKLLKLLPTTSTDDQTRSRIEQSIAQDFEGQPD